MKKIQKGASKRIVYSATALLFVFAMAGFAAVNFQFGKNQTAQLNDSGSDRTGPCVPTNIKCGRLIVKKDAIPDDYQDFTFNHTIPGYTSSWIMDDDADGTLVNPSNIPNYKNFSTPANGNFTITEQLIQPVYNPITNQFEGGYNVSIYCTDPSGGTVTSGNSVNVSMYGGETITCTFKNTPMAPTSGQQACTPNSWTQKADFGGIPRVGAFGFFIGTKGYVGTGTSDPNVYYQDFWEYNPATNIWTQKANFGGGLRASAVGFSIGTKGYAGTGTSTTWNSFQDFWEYNPATNIWTQKAYVGGLPRAEAAGFSIGTKGYIGMGFAGVNGNLEDFWEYDPITNLWIQKANYGGGKVRYAPVGFSIGAKGYVGTGQKQGNQNYNEFWEYNPATNLWTQKADFGGSPRGYASGFSIGNKGYIGTGISNPQPWIFYSDFWEYNPLSDTWTPKASVGGPARLSAVGFRVGAKGYIGTGGWDWSTVTNSWEYEYGDFWEYCP